MVVLLLSCAIHRSDVRKVVNSERFAQGQSALELSATHALLLAPDMHRAVEVAVVGASGGRLGVVSGGADFRSVGWFEQSDFAIVTTQSSFLAAGDASTPSAGATVVGGAMVHAGPGGLTLDLADAMFSISLPVSPSAAGRTYVVADGPVCTDWGDYWLSVGTTSFYARPDLNQGAFATRNEASARDRPLARVMERRGQWTLVETCMGSGVALVRGWVPHAPEPMPEGTFEGRSGWLGSGGFGMYSSEPGDLMVGASSGLHSMPNGDVAGRVAMDFAMTPVSSRRNWVAVEAYWFGMDRVLWVRKRDTGPIDTPGGYICLHTNETPTWHPSRYQESR